MKDGRQEFGTSSTRAGTVNEVIQKRLRLQTELHSILEHKTLSCYSKSLFRLSFNTANVKQSVYKSKEMQQYADAVYSRK
jgi:hypothetical protein